MERLIITFKNDGTFRGASLTDFNGLPQSLDEAALTALFPTLNAAALAQASANDRQDGTEYLKNIKQLLKDEVTTNKQKVDAIQLEIDAWTTAKRAARQAELEAQIAAANAELLELAAP